MTAPTEVTTLPMTIAIARVAGIAPDGRLALQIDFADPKGNRTVVFTLDPEAVFQLSDELWRTAMQVKPAAAQEWAASEVARMDLASSAPMGSA